MGGGKGSDQRQPVDLHYLSLHLGICVGPLDRIHRIFYGEKVAWRGSLSSSAVIEIDQGELFGGQLKEGGLEGRVHYLDGSSSQVLPAELATRMGRTPSTVSGFRGFASLFFTGSDSTGGFYFSANNPYLKPIAVEGERTAGSGWYPEKARIPRDTSGPVSIYIAIDNSGSMLQPPIGVSGGPTRKQIVQAALGKVLDHIRAAVPTTRVDLGVCFYSTGPTFHQIERTEIDGSDLDDCANLISTYPTTPAHGTNVVDPATRANDWFTATVGADLERRIFILLTDAATDDGASTAAAGVAADMLSRTGGTFNENDGTAVDCYVVNVGNESPANSQAMDNTPEDGVPVIGFGGDDALTAIILNAIFDRYDANPAHLIYDCVTNRQWGMSARPEGINLDSLQAMADTLYNERLGLTYYWVRQSTIQEVVDDILAHVQGLRFINPRTGLWEFRLIRDDYDLESTKELTPQNSVVARFERKGFGETTGEIQVTWSNPVSRKEETAIAQDLANIAIQGGVVSDSRNYHAVHRRDLALELAMRDLTTASAPIASADVSANRAFWDVLPGEVVRLTWPEHGLDKVPMRVLQIDYGKPGDSAIRLALMEDVFSLTMPEFDFPEPPPVPQPPGPPQEMAHVKVIELPAYVASQIVGPEFLAGIGYPSTMSGVLAADPAQNPISFNLHGEITLPNEDTEFDSLGEKSVAGRGQLQEALGATAQSTGVKFISVSSPGPAANVFCFLGEGGDDEIEIALILSGNANDGYVLRRGVLDTVPRDWPADTPVWFVPHDLIFYDETERSAGDTVDYKVLTRTTMGLLPFAQAQTHSLELIGRPQLPTRPADVTVGGVAFGLLDLIGVELPENIAVAWANRNRLMEDTVVLAWDEANIAPEDGQTTKITVMDAERNVLTVHDELEGTGFNVPIASFEDGESELAPVAIVRVTAERDGLESLQGHEVRVRLIDTPGTILISGNFVYVDAAVDTTVGTLSTVGGEPPYTYEIVDD